MSALAVARAVPQPTTPMRRRRRRQGEPDEGSWSETQSSELTRAPKKIIEVHSSPKRMILDQGVIARRAGCRIKGCRRTSLVRYNPRGNGDCGFQAVLASSKAQTYEESSAVAQRRSSHSTDPKVQTGSGSARHQVSAFVAQQDMGMDDCAAAVRRNLWASPIELSLACELVGIAAVLRDNHSQITLAAAEGRS